MIQNLTHELAVLAKAVQHKNLSAASVHVGISQPQLSRLIAKLESELNVLLLDRSARRKSGWTPLAHELALAYTKGIGRLTNEILAVAKDIESTELRIGTLEGLSQIASQFAQQCFEKLEVKTVYLDILDFKDLDSQFLSGDLDLLFTVRSPSKQKFTHQLEVGYQQMEKVSTDPNILVCSPSEISGVEKKQGGKNQRFLISNSLSIRSNWLHKVGGTGSLPIDAQKGRGKGYYSVYLFGQEMINPKLWKKISDLFE
ncbi:MAG: LysR family transcriptional regulator [Bdellovibrio sp. CG10_big_fil_rev_8_21_14_0_10_47_8]|nr:MAG: LysR family transcriptional regulator [Bdellovibrio sp. CG10_big_fil_rev_8_21_14_0_10_47_8]